MFCKSPEGKKKKKAKRNQEVPESDESAEGNLQTSSAQDKADMREIMGMLQRFQAKLDNDVETLWSNIVTKSELEVVRAELSLGRTQSEPCRQG